MTIHVFAELVGGPDDVVGALAYALYKQTKVEWRLAMTVANHGAEPTAEQQATFYAQNSLPIQLQGFRDRADALTTGFLKKALRQKLAVLVPVVTQSAFAENVQSSHQSVVAELKSMRGDLQAKRGVGGWLADAGASFLVNVLVVVFIGVIVIGYQHFALITSWFEQRVQIPVTPATAAPEQPGVNAPASPPH